MNDLTARGASHLPVNTDEERASLRALHELIDTMPQTRAEIKELLYAGIYVRVASIPADQVAMGCELKVPTTLTVVGDCDVTLGGKAVPVIGYAVFSGEVGRKTAFLTHSPTVLVMTYRTDAKTLGEVRRELTDELLQEEKF